MVAMAISASPVGLKENERERRDSTAAMIETLMPSARPFRCHDRRRFGADSAIR
jgi:hypothetical protein